jgi:uncharacterized protein
LCDENYTKGLGLEKAMKKINLNDVLKESFNEVVVNFENDIDNVKVKMTGNFRNTNGVIELNGKIHAEYKANCARCLKSISESIILDIKENIISSEDAINTDAYCYEGKIFDLEILIRDYIYLNLPEKVLCNENCKGICVKCGIDLNDSLCTCHNKDINPKFDILKDFFNN